MSIIQINRCIHKDFPKKTLVNTFNDYIIDYLTECYSFNNILRTISKRNLKKNLKKFKTLNPKYGRKIYKINNAFNINNIITNNTNPNDISNNVFIFGNTNNTNNTNTNNDTNNYEYTFVDNVIEETPIRNTIRRNGRNGRNGRNDRNDRNGRNIINSK